MTGTFHNTGQSSSSFLLELFSYNDVVVSMARLMCFLMVAACSAALSSAQLLSCYRVVECTSDPFSSCTETQVNCSSNSDACISIRSTGTQGGTCAYMYGSSASVEFAYICICRSQFSSSLSHTLSHTLSLSQDSHMTCEKLNPGDQSAHFCRRRLQKNTFTCTVFFYKIVLIRIWLFQANVSLLSLLIKTIV